MLPAGRQGGGRQSGGRRRLVLVGGGHAHLFVLEAFANEPLADLEITLIGRDRWTPYSGMLPGAVAGHYGFEEAHIDLVPLCERAGVRFVQDEVTGLDLEARQAHLQEGAPVAFDMISLDIGSTPALEKLAGAREHAVPVKPISRFLQRWQELQARVAAAAGPFAIGVVGGGAGGVELILAMEWALRGAPTVTHSKGLRFVLINADDAVLKTLNARARRRMRKILEEREIELVLGHRVQAVTAEGVRLDNRALGGESVMLDEVLLVTQAAAQAWVRKSGLRTDDRGFALVDRALRSRSHPFVFAAGDIAHVEGYDRPKAGVYAVRQGPQLADNLRRALCDRPVRQRRPQKGALSLIGTGGDHAIAARGPFYAEGRWVWALKQWLDRRFMRRFQC